jgi:hypothetical protein
MGIYQNWFFEYFDNWGVRGVKWVCTKIWFFEYFDNWGVRGVKWV